MPLGLGNPSIPLAFAGWLLTLTLAMPAVADDAEGRARLAPPGPCAEPREALTAASLAPGSIIGPLSDLFNPVDVAAAPPRPARQGRPAIRNRIRPGSCDEPGSGGCTPVGQSSVGRLARPNPPDTPTRPRP